MGFIKKRFTQGLKLCYNCNKSSVVGNFCSECGDILGITSVELEYRTCHYCGEEIPDRNYCINCGHKKPYDLQLEEQLDDLHEEFVNSQKIKEER